MELRERERVAAFRAGQRWFEGVWDKHAFVNALTGGLHWMDYWEDKPPPGFIPGVLVAVNAWEQACCPA